MTKKAILKKYNPWLLLTLPGGVWSPGAGEFDLEFDLDPLGDLLVAAGSPFVAESRLGLNVVDPELAFEPLLDLAGWFLRTGSFLGGWFEGIAGLDATGWDKSGSDFVLSDFISITSGSRSIFITSGVEFISITSAFESTLKSGSLLFVGV